MHLLAVVVPDPAVGQPGQVLGVQLGRPAVQQCHPAPHLWVIKMIKNSSAAHLIVCGVCPPCGRAADQLVRLVADVGLQLRQDLGRSSRVPGEVGEVKMGLTMKERRETLIDNVDNDNKGSGCQSNSRAHVCLVWRAPTCCAWV